MTESAAKEVTLFCENANNRFLNVPRLRLAYEAALARFVLQICFNHGKFCRIIAIISTAGSVLSHIEVEVHSSFDIQAVLKAEVEPDGQLISYGDQQSITVTHVFPIDQTFYVEYVGSATDLIGSGSNAALTAAFSSMAVGNISANVQAIQVYATSTGMGIRFHIISTTPEGYYRNGTSQTTVNSLNARGSLDFWYSGQWVRARPPAATTTVGSGATNVTNLGADV